MPPKTPTRLIVRSVGWLHGKRAFALAGLVLLIVGSAGYWLGRSNIAAGGGWFDDAARLRETIGERDETIETLRRQAAELDTLKAGQADERREVGRTIGELQAEIARQKQQLEFFRGIVAQDAERPNVAIRTLRLTVGSSPQSRMLRLALVQPGNPQGIVSGTIVITLEGSRGGRLARLPEPERGYSFQYLENVEQELTPPSGFTPERVTVQIKPLGGKGEGVIQSILWPAVGS
ncbi:MAG: hypothetical protein FGM43_12035 [Sinobacteraceae bacterium]|nr:hypothetical protein [Nevskiaceae bacterium]